ncbi:MAG: hypothetical protein PHP45_06240 [Elusimicrobiales bacterium]|nr:hypothetical protein [Elusimicrobiales bacterium]
MKEGIIAACAIAVLALAVLWFVNYNPNGAGQADIPAMPEFKRLLVTPDKQQSRFAAFFRPVTRIFMGGKAEIPQTPTPHAGAKPAAAAIEKPCGDACFADSRSKISLLEELIRKENPNDPRLDSAFNHLSTETKRLFRQEYVRFPPESFNARGTIVYLLGKNLTRPEDWAFLRDVVSEPPCLSLSNCARAGPVDSHLAEVEITLAYPAVMALQQAENVLVDHKAGRPIANESFVVAQAMALVRTAKNSKAAIVSEEAARLEKSY